MPDHRSRNPEKAAHRLNRRREEQMQTAPADEGEARGPQNVHVDCGWGRLLFAHSFTAPGDLLKSLRDEGSGKRDIAFYVRDPQIIVGSAPQELFLDPSHTYRLDLATYRPARRKPTGFAVRRLVSEADAQAINRIYAGQGMVEVAPDFFYAKRDSRTLIHLVAENSETGAIIGTVTGVNHSHPLQDSAAGASLWCLAIDPQAHPARIGEALIRHLAEYLKTRNCAFIDLSVMYDNDAAIALYEKLGFRRRQLFTVKRKNPINEPLFTATPDAEGDQGLNPYAEIIVKEARRRGIDVELIDAEGALFRLTYGGRSIACRESLSDLTSAVALSICDDKDVTRRVVARAGVTVPRRIDSEASDTLLARFLGEVDTVVVKPARGEQGRGISIGLDSVEAVHRAIADARAFSNRAIIEECVEGLDLRIVVIDYRVVAAAIRRPATIVGDGQSSVKTLIERQSRRRSAATGGESRIPLDEETRRCLTAAGLDWDSVPEAEREVAVRRTANLHTGGTMHDVTDQLHPALVDAAIRAARAIDIPVTGIDLIVQSPTRPDYSFIEANERPGLANHEPQPTAERFVDLLFPQSMPQATRRAWRNPPKKERAT